MFVPGPGRKCRALLGAIPLLGALAGNGCGDTPTEESPTVASVTVVAPSVTSAIRASTSHQLTARVLDADGNVLTGHSVAWSSSATAVASITESGILRALAPGNTTITAAVGGVSGKQDVVVLPVAVATVTITTSKPVSSVVENSSHQLGVRVLDAEGKVLEGRTVTWSSSMPAVATISESGLLRALSAGSATITAAVENVSHALEVSVQPVLLLSQLALGERHSCGLTPAGIAMCWGVNDQGQLGRTTTETCVDRGNPAPRPCGRVPAEVEGGHVFTTLTSGREQHTCGLTATGAAWCWGANARGQLGDGTTATRSTPVAVAGAIAFTTLVAGGTHTCGTSAAGVAYCWGANASGQLGRAPGSDEPLPAPITGTERFTALSAGGTHTCGITSTGAFCWGSNSLGELGNGSRTSTAIPAPVHGPAFTSLAAGSGHTCGLLDGALWCWGNNYDRQLGVGETGSCYVGFDTFVQCLLSPKQLSPGMPIRAISAGRSHTCAIGTNEVALCWGSDYGQELGNGEVQGRQSLPVLVQGGLRYTTIATGHAHTCAIATNKATYCWGSNEMGQLGPGEDSGCPSVATTAFTCRFLPTQLRIPVAGSGSLAEIANSPDVRRSSSHRTVPARLH